MQTIKFAPQVCPSNQTPTNNHHLQTQFEGLPLTTNPQIGRQTLNKFDYPKKAGPKAQLGPQYLNGLEQLC